jgi:ProP effector
MRSAQRHAAQETRRRLVELFPRCFKSRGEPKLPLKLNILDDILWRCPELGEAAVRLALADYSFGETYLNALRSGAIRIDLDGHPAGTVSAFAAHNARVKLRRMLAHNANQTRRAVQPSEAHPVK